MMDLYGAQVHFNSFQQYGEDIFERHRQELNTLWNSLSTNIRTVCMGVDASVPKATRHNVTAAYVYEGLGNQRSKGVTVAGRVLSSDAELLAIRMAVGRATALEDCDRIAIFTDSLAMAKRAVDPGIHSGQAFSLATCKALHTWFAAKADRRVDFIETPSKLKWGLQHRAHLHA